MERRAPLKRVTRDELPEEPRRWLDATATLPHDVTWIPARARQLTIDLITFSIIFAITLVTAAVWRTGPIIIFALVGAVLFFIAGYLWRQRRREQAALNASPRLGVLLGPRELVWAPSLSECTLFERAQLEPIIVDSSFGSDVEYVRLVQELPRDELHPAFRRRIFVELDPNEVAFEGTPDALAAKLEAWRAAGR